MREDVSGVQGPGAEPDVTVVIPTRDRWPLLSRALESVLTQEDVAMEVIVVDDGSADETPRRLAELRDPRLRVLRTERSRGVASARNLGMAHATASWIAFLDDDDIWAPRKLRTELDCAASGASFVYTGMVVIGDEAGPMQIGPPSPEELPQSLLHDNTVGAPSTVMVRADLVRRAGGFDERLSALADWDLWIRLIVDERATPAACPEPLVAYMLHPQNMHRAEADSILPEFHRLAAKNRGRGGAFGGTQFFHWIAASQRRRGRRRAAARTYFEAAARYRSVGDLLRGIGVLLGEPVMALGRRPQARVLTQVPIWAARHTSD